MFTISGRWAGLYLFVCVLSGITTCKGQQQPSSPYSKLAEYYYYKCYNQTLKLDPFNKLNNDATEFNSYFQYTMQFLPKEKKVFCQSERKSLNQRMAELSKDLRVCLPPNEQYLADFIKTSFGEFLHFLCHNEGENIDRIFSSRAANCREALFNDNSNQIGNCLSRIFKPLRGYTTSQEVCDDFTTAKKCFLLALDEKCPRYTPYKDLVGTMFAYVSKPCSGCINNANTVIFMLSLLIYYLFSH